MKFRHVEDVIRWRLCLGCGACLSVCQDGFIKLINKESKGIKPVVTSMDCGACDKCLAVCPGFGISKSE